MKNKLLASGLILLVAVNVSALLTFAYHRWVKPKGEWQAASPASPICIEKHLSLSGEQEKCVRDIRFSFDQETEGIHAQIQEKRIALIEEMKKDVPDMASVDKLIEEISQLQTEIQKKAVLNLFKEKQVLTPEQKEKFLQMFEDHVCSREKKARRDSPGAANFR